MSVGSRAKGFQGKHSFTWQHNVLTWKMSETICIDTTIVSLHALKETFKRQFGGNKDRPERVSLTPYIIIAYERKRERKGPQKVQKKLEFTRDRLP